jgi:hypothetical protein
MELTLVALAVVGAAYLTAPALGYVSHTRGLLLGSLWALVGQLALGAIRFGLNLLDEKELQRPVRLVLSGLELILFLLAMALFVAGLSSLRRKDEVLPPRRPFDRGD